MARKFDVYLGFPENDTRDSIKLEGVTFGGENLDESEAADRILAVIANNMEVDAVSGEYRVTVKLVGEVTFDFEDEDGDYADESDVREAFMNGSLDWSDYDDTPDLEVDEVKVDEA